LRDAYLVDTVEQAWELASRYPRYRFVASTGEVVQDHVVGWGEGEALGPLSLKREIRDLDHQFDSANRETVAREAEMVRLEGLVKDADARRLRLAAEIQQVEKTILTADHRVRTLTADYSHAEQRVQVARSEIGRFTEERQQLEISMLEAEAQ